MTSQIIGNNKVALYLEEKDLAERGLDQPSCEGDELKTLVLEMLGSLGIRTDGNMEIEIFNGGASILVFAIVGIDPSVSHLVFDDIELLIQAAGALIEFPLHSKLTYWDRKYWLELKDFGDTAEKTALLLGEFGRHLAPEEYRECVLSEYGVVIEKDNVLRAFQRAFHSD